MTNRNVGCRSTQSARNPISLAIAKSRWLKGGSALALSTALISTDLSAQVLEEVLVSARKKTESLQDAPLAIQAFNSQALEELNISNFDNYALMLPSLSYTSAGPGLSQIYMRGASDGGDGNASGQQPSVGIYLDEQPVTAIGRNLDIHIYDIERVEALAGPQGTLYGASSQGGTLRIITNKPNTEEFEAGFDLGYSDTDEGEDSYSVEGFINQPLSDNAAIRIVAWDKEDGGYIDNIAGTRSYQLSDENGVPDGALTTETNDGLVKDDFNELENSGARIALKVDLNDSWTATASYLTQEQETEGVWFHDPENDNGEVGDLEVQRFNEDSSNDEFDQFALTVEGDLGFATLTYAGSMMERDVEYNNDYSDYSQDNGWVSNYACGYDYSGYYDSGPITSRCTSGNIFYEEENEYERNTHEIRLQSQGDSALQYIVGFFYEDATHEYRQEWLMPGMADGDGYNILDKENLWYLTDQKREDEQTALFGEVSYDITDRLTATVGARFFENESTLKGVTGYGIQALDNNYPRLDVDSKTDDDDSIFKVNLSYALTDDKNIYFTWSEGYRAGGINRDETPGVVPLEYDPDFLTNWEFGWKTTWMDQRLRWNGAAYFMEWEDMQFTKFDSAVFDSPVGLTINVGEAEITGLESDLTFIPAEGWTLSGAFAYNEAELSKDFTVGSTLLPDGTELPHVPELKYNLSGRYEFGVGEFDAFGQLVYAYVDESYSDIFVADREEQDSYDNVNFSAGLSKDNWGIDLYVNNLTDERAEISRTTQPYGNYITTNRPRTIGIKYRMRF